MIIEITNLHCLLILFHWITVASNCFQSIFDNVLSEEVRTLFVYIKSNMSIHENNYEASIPEETILPQFNPWNKHYLPKHIWFCEEIHNHGLKLNNNSTMY